MYHAFKPLAMKIPNGWEIYVAQIQWDIKVEEKGDWWSTRDSVGKLRHYFTFFIFSNLNLKTQNFVRNN